jgi:hypothetical protein
MDQPHEHDAGKSDEPLLTRLLEYLLDAPNAAPYDVFLKFTYFGYGGSASRI